ncbi:MAG: FHA domain-containing protein [Gemmataceae bacterium]|nr:FHA domain-containing protein [Gemmataceae bacterium]
MRAQLIPLDGGEPIEIVKDMIVVGRKEDCDLRLDHKSVSKLHCIIVKTDGLLLLRDLGSTNGTRVNGQRIRRAALLPNDNLNIANFRFRVYLGPGEPPLPGGGGGGDMHTQQMDAKEVAHLLRKASAAKGNNGGAPALPVQPNILPDVYPNDKGGKEA